MFSFSAEPVDVDKLASSLADPRAGALVTFEGRVRNHNEGQHVLSLEYEAFESLGLKEAEKIFSEARSKFDLIQAECVHRTGCLEIGEVAVWVGVIAAHRGAAFDACRFIIDEIKHRLPIWKKEHYPGGNSLWVNCQSCQVAGAVRVGAHAGSHAGASGGQAGVALTSLEFSAAPPVTTDFSVPGPGGASFDAGCGSGGSNGGTLDASEFYSRQTRLPQIGSAGQEKLKNARVLVIGAGGLGSSALMYLGAAGIGTVGICEPDKLEASNLHRQVLYSAADLLRGKADLAARRLRENNPFIQVSIHNQRLLPENALSIMGGYDLVLDCTDNFDAKFLIADAAHVGGVTLIQSSVYQYEGQIQMSSPAGQGQCLRCLWPEIPEAGCVGSCADTGILGSVTGVFGCLQATEAVKHIVGLPSALGEHVVFFDLLTYGLRKVKRVKNPDCPLCGRSPSITQIEVARYSAEPTVMVADWEVDILTLSQRDLAEYQMIDIREAGEDTASLLKRLLRVPCIELPLSKFDTSNPPIEEGHKYLIVCQRGVRSGKLVAALRGRGYRNVFSVLGGIEAIRRKFIA